MEYNIIQAVITQVISKSDKHFPLICNGNWTEWSTIQGVFAQAISKSDVREARGRFEITN